MPLIDTHTVEIIAKLARIRLNEEEAARIHRELSQVIEFIETLNELDTHSVEPVRGGTHLENTMRSDTDTAPFDAINAASLVEASPEHQNGWIKVKPVFTP